MSYNGIVGSTLLLSSLIIGSVVAQNPPGRRDTVGVLQIDHIIVAVADLQDGTRQMKELTGVEAVFGGHHPGAGTQNALIAIGPRTYLEVLAPQSDIDVPEPLEWILTLDDLTPMGFAVSTPDVSGTIALLENHGYVTSDPTPGSRSLPNGEALMWTTMEINEPVIVDAPFFIQWDGTSPHPATTSPRGCALRSLKVASPNKVELERLFRVLGLDVVVENAAGQDPVYQVVLDCPKGTVSLK